MVTLIMILAQRKNEDVIGRDTETGAEMLLAAGLMKRIATTRVTAS